MTHYTITSDEEFSGATVIFSDGSTHTIGSDNPNYTEVVRELLAGEATEEELLQLIAPFELIYRKLTKLSERVSRKGMRLFFDGDAVANALAQHIIKIMDEGAPEEEWQAWIKFWEKAATNPSLKSQDELFVFVEKHGLSITSDGDAVLYKGVRADGTSSHAGPGIVDGVEYESAHLPNHIGAVVEIPRSDVDPNRGVACSKGLHVGDYTYASSFAPKLLNVIVNPRDVVSVPLDENDRKIRVCRYVVASANEDKVMWGAAVVDPYETPEPVDEEDLFAADEEDEDEVAGDSIPAQAAAPATPVAQVVQALVQKVAAGDGSRVEEYKNLIRSGGAGSNLRKFRNKKVTAGRRAEFDEAVRQLGLQY